MRTMHWVGSAALVWMGTSPGQAAVIRSAEPFVGVTTGLRTTLQF
ncbi:MAG TPA: hypothetical protein PKB10_04215 [Tepidisphaeraceae bacterium]|nr:hypothetical protein [Tepidisphaeraceae bacterium]